MITHLLPTVIFALLPIVNGQDYYNNMAVQSAYIPQKPEKPYTMVTYLCHKQPYLSLCNPYKNYKVLGPKSDYYGIPLTTSPLPNQPHRWAAVYGAAPEPYPRPRPLGRAAEDGDAYGRPQRDDPADAGPSDLARPKQTRRKLRPVDAEAAERAAEDAAKARAKGQTAEPADVTQSPEIEESTDTGVDDGSGLPEPEPEDDDDLKESAVVKEKSAKSAEASRAERLQQAYQEYMAAYKKYLAIMQEGQSTVASSSYYNYNSYAYPPRRYPYYGPQQQQQQSYYYQPQQQAVQPTNGLGFGTQLTVPYAGNIGWSSGVWGK